MLGARDTVWNPEEPIVIHLEVGFPCERRALHGTIEAAKHHSSIEHVSQQPSASALRVLPPIASHPQNPNQQRPMAVPDSTTPTKAMARDEAPLRHGSACKPNPNIG